MLIKSDNCDILEHFTPECFIRVPLCHQENPYSCGVACVQAILASYGIIYMQDVLAEILKQQPIYGTEYKNILTFLRMLGFQASFHMEMNVALLKELINSGITPILILQAWKDTSIDYTYDWKDSHYVIACGYDNNRILFMDPWVLGYYTYLPNDILMKRWHNFDYSETQCYYAGLVITHDQLPYIYNYDIIKPMD